jgi:hypothetical protein
MARLREWGPLEWALLLFAILFQIFAFSHDENRRLIGDEGTYLQAARALAQGLEAQEHPFWPPLQARFLALIARMGGPDHLLFFSLQILLLAGSAALLSSIASSLGAHSRHADRAGLLLFAYPEWIGFTHLFWPEVPHLFFLLASLRFVLAEKRASFRHFCAGLCLGVALGFKFLLLGMLPLWLLWLFYRLLIRARCELPAVSPLRLVARSLPVLGAWLLGFALVFAPIAVRHRLVFGPGALQAAASFNLWVGLTQPKEREYHSSFVGKAKAEFDSWPAPWSRRNQQALAYALQHVETKGVLQVLWAQLGKQPGRLLSAETTYAGMIPPGINARRNQPPSPAHRLARAWLKTCHLVLLATSLLGWSGMRRRAGEFLVWSFGFLLANLFLYLVLHAKTRFFLPLVPFLLLRSAWWTFPDGQKANLASIASSVLRLPQVLCTAAGLFLAWLSCQGL